VEGLELLEGSGTLVFVHIYKSSKGVLVSDALKFFSWEFGLLVPVDAYQVDWMARVFND
jgi:hypothetical protein